MKVKNVSKGLLVVNLNTTPPVGLHLAPGEESRELKPHELHREVSKLIKSKKLIVVGAVEEEAPAPQPEAKDEPQKPAAPEADADSKAKSTGKK